MANYLDFLRITKRGEIRRVYWVCGQEEVLREQVALSLRRIAVKLGVQPMDSRTVMTEEEGEETVWEALDAWPLDPERQAFLVVRDAEKIKHTERIAEWLMDRSAPKRLAVFVADEPAWPTDRKTEVRDRIVKSGMYVECGKASEKTAVEVTQSWLQSDEKTATELLTYVGWQLDRARDVAKKARLLGTTAPHVLRFLAEPDSKDKYVEELLACDRKAALTAAGYVETYQERYAAVGLLDSNLAALAKINATLRSTRSPREVMSRSGLHRLQVEKLLPHARLYDPEAVRRRTIELAKADRALAEGAEIGVLEVLAAQW